MASNKDIQANNVITFPINSSLPSLKKKNKKKKRSTSKVYHYDLNKLVVGVVEAVEGVLTFDGVQYEVQGDVVEDEPFYLQDEKAIKIKLKLIKFIFIK